MFLKKNNQQFIISMTCPNKLWHTKAACFLFSVLRNFSSMMLEDGMKIEKNCYFLFFVIFCLKLDLLNLLRRDSKIVFYSLRSRVSFVKLVFYLLISRVSFIKPVFYSLRSRVSFIKLVF